MGSETQEANPASTGRGHLIGRLGITAGVFDAAMSSLATFLAGIIAVNILGGTELGVYAVFFTAFNFGQVVANNLVYIPAEVVAVRWGAEARTRVLMQSIPLGILPSLAGASAIAVASLVAAQFAPIEVWGPLTITAAGTTFLWPTQDHIRRVLHIAERSWAAASVSIAHFVFTALSIGALLLLDVRAEWIPFGALAMANLASLLVGLLLAKPMSGAPSVAERLKPRDLTRSGRWLMMGVGIPPITAFGAAAIITFVAGPEVLAFAEAARIAAHPVLVLGTGLGYVMGPRVMRGAISRSREVSRRNHRRFNSLVAAAAVAYALLVGFDWAGNPMAWLVPKAYEVEWLVIATVFANILMSALVLVIQELTAAGKARTIAAVSAIAAPIQLLGAATAGVTEAFARPISLAVGGGALLFGNTRAIGDIYLNPETGQEPVA